MTDRLKDNVLLLFACMALCVEIALLLAQMRLLPISLPWGTDQTSGKPIGFVETQKRSLRDRPRGSLTWYPRASGDAIHLDDTLMTGPDASARIRIAGRGALDLGPDTLIQFSEQSARSSRLAKGDVLNLEIDEGRIHVLAGASELRMKIKGSEIKLPAGGRIAIDRSEPGAETRISVEEGEVELTRTSPAASADTEVTRLLKPSSTHFLPRLALKEGESIALDRAQEKPTIAKAPVEPTAKEAAPREPSAIELPVKVEHMSPAAGARLVASGEEASVRFSWMGDGNAVEIAETKEFQPARQLPLGNNGVLAQLPPGRYFWRVRRQLAASEGVPFSVLPDPRYRLASPATGKRVKSDSPVVLTWRAVPQAATYEVQVSTSQSFDQLLVDESTSATHLSVGKLSPGRYFWRVTARSSDWGSWPASPSVAFSVKRAVTAPRLKGFKILTHPRKSPSGWLLPPSTGSRLAARIIDWIIPEAHAEGKREVGNAPTAAADSEVEIEFGWEAVEGATSYLLEVAGDPSFRLVLSHTEGTETSQRVMLPRREKYYWRVAARDVDGELSPFAISPEPVPAPAVAPSNPMRVSSGLRPESDASIVEAPSIPRALLPWYLPSRLRIGWGEVLRNETYHGSDFTMNSRGGLPILSLLLSKIVGTTEVGAEADLGHISYASRTLSSSLGPSQSGPDSAHSSIDWQSARLYVKRAWGGLLPSTVPVTLGVEYATQADFVRESADLLRVRRVPTFALIAGPTIGLFNEGRSFGELQLLAELAPAGLVRGAGLYARATFGYRRLWGAFSPQIQIAFHPAYYTIAGADRSFFRMDFGPSLFVGFAFEPPLSREEEAQLEKLE